MCIWVILRAGPATAGELKVVTQNLWHGLSFEGIVKMGSLEEKGRKERRMDNLLKLLREQSPDLLFLEEANPARSVARLVAHTLSLDEIHQVSNGGVKLYWGIPVNLDEGLIILARKGLGLERMERVKLPGSGFGRCGDYLSIQFKEIRYALIGRILWEGSEVIVVGTHLHHVPSPTKEILDVLEEAVRTGGIDSSQYQHITRIMVDGAKMRQAQIRWLAHYLEERYPGKPIVLAGDFNATPESPEIKELTGQAGYLDTFALEGSGSGYTWDMDRNSNTENSLWTAGVVKVRDRAVIDALEELQGRGRRIDYIFLNRCFDAQQIEMSQLFADRPVDGGFCSDHFGLLTRISFSSR